MTANVKTRASRSPARRQFDQRKYGRLLARAAPAVIRNDAECRRVEDEITKLLGKGDNLTPEEERLLDLLVPSWRDMKMKPKTSRNHRPIAFCGS